MFYLETKDGDRFFTDPNSDDVAEFEKILKQKLGTQVSDFFKQLIHEAENKANLSLQNDIDYIIGELRDLQSRLDG